MRGLSVITTLMASGALVTGDSTMELYEYSKGPSVSNEAQPVALKMTTISNPMGGWFAGSLITGFKERNMMIPAFVPESTINPGKIQFECSSYKDINRCDAYVYVYMCRESCGDVNEGFASSLTAGGFEQATACTPTFITAPGARTHRLTTFRRQLERGETVTVYITEPVKLSFFALDSKGTDCSEFAVEKCESSGFPQCKVVNGACVDEWKCPKITGPFAEGSGACDCCALDDAVFQRS